MYEYIFPALYGWLASSAFLHLCIDVAYPLLSRKPHATAIRVSYYMWSVAFLSLQLSFSMLGLSMAWQGAGTAPQLAIFFVCLTGSFGRLATVFFLADRWEALSSIAVYGVLVFIFAILLVVK